MSPYHVTPHENLENEYCTNIRRYRSHVKSTRTRTLVITFSAVVLALQCNTVMEVFTRFAPPAPRRPPRKAPSEEKACRIIMFFPQPSGPTRMNGSLFSIHGSIMAKARCRKESEWEPSVGLLIFICKVIVEWSRSRSLLCIATKRESGGAGHRAHGITRNYRIDRTEMTP